MIAPCTRCSRGAEACEWCEHVSEDDWRAMCDCGLFDFGDHLLDCEARSRFLYVVAIGHASAELPRVTA